MFATAIHLHPSLIFAGKARAYYKNGVLWSAPRLVLPTNVGLEWKWMDVSNTLAYYDTASSIAIKSFIVQAPGNKDKLSICIISSSFSSVLKNTF